MGLLMIFTCAITRLTRNTAFRHIIHSKYHIWIGFLPKCVVIGDAGNCDRGPTRLVGM